jgi:hypothetical protein
MQKLHIRTNRKFWIVVASVIVAILIVTGGAYWLLRSAESGAEASINKSKSDVGSSLQTLNTKLINKEITPKDRLAAFNGFSQSLATISNDLCKSDSKNIMFGISKAKQRCDAAHQKLLAVKVAGEKIEASVKDDQLFSTVLDPAKSADPTDGAKQLAAWDAVLSKVPSVSVSQDTTPIKNHLLAVANAHKIAWQELIDADKAQNKTSYNASITKLNTAHAELAKISDEQSAAFKKLLTRLRDAITSLKQ